MKHLTGMLCLLLLTSAVRAEPSGCERRSWDLRAITEGRASTAVDRLGLGAAYLGFEDESDSPEYEWGGRQDRGFVSPEALEDLVRTRLATPGFWVDSDASVEVRADRLVVRAPRALLDKVDALVGDVWRAAARRVTVDVRLVSLGPAAVESLEKEGRLAAVEDGRLTDEDRRALLDLARQDGNALATGTIVVPDGRLGATGPITSVSYIRDFDVEIAQGSIVGDPIVDRVREGWRVHARPHLLSDGSVLLESLVQRASLERPMRRAMLEADALGTLDLPAIRLARVFACSRLRPGETRVVLARRHGRSLRALLVTVRTPASTPLATPFLGVSALTVPRAGYVLRRPQSGFGALAPVLVWSPGDPVDGGDDVARLLDRRLDTGNVEDLDAVADLDGVVLPRPDAEETVRRTLGQVERSALRTWRVRLSVRDGDGPAVRAKRSRHAVALDVAAGRSVCLQAGVERNYVADWDVEVAQESRVGDPIVGNAFGGLALTLRVDPTPRADRVAVRLDLLLSDLAPEIETVRSRNAVTGILEVPRISESRLERDLVLAVGSPTTVDVSVDGGVRRTVEIVVEDRP